MKHSDGPQILSKPVFTSAVVSVMNENIVAGGGSRNNRGRSCAIPVSHCADIGSSGKVTLDGCPLFPHTEQPDGSSGHSLATPTGLRTKNVTFDASDGHKFLSKPVTSV